MLNSNEELLDSSNEMSVGKMPAYKSRRIVLEK